MFGLTGNHGHANKANMMSTSFILDSMGIIRTQKNYAITKEIMNGKSMHTITNQIKFNHKYVYVDCHVILHQNKQN